MMDSKGIDHFFLKVKDVCLLLISVGAMGSWVLGITQVPPRVEANEIRIEELREYMGNNEVFVKGLQKDIEVIKTDLSEIKVILKRTAPYERRGNGAG